jgi:hypothetical protein
VLVPEVLAYATIAGAATIGVGTPVAIYFALGDRSRDLLDGLKWWKAENNAVIMAVLLLVIGVELIGQAITGFSN